LRSGAATAQKWTRCMIGESLTAAYRELDEIARGELD
jgi:hypothetical protein